MAGYIPAASPPGIVRIDGQDPVELTGDGLTLVPGQGVLARTTVADRRIQLDAVLADPTQSVHLFRPGLVTGGVLLGKWANTTRAKATYLRELQVNLGVAPSAGDASNYYRVRVTDGLGSNIHLPISAAGVAHYLLDQGLGVDIAAPYNTSAASLALLGVATPFSPSQPLTITGAKVKRCGVNKFSTGEIIAAATIRASLLDSDFRTIAEATALSSAAANLASLPDMGWAFPTAVELTAGQTYYIAFDHWSWYPGSIGSAGFNIVCGNVDGANPEAQPITLLAGRTGLAQVAGTGPDLPAAMGGLTWEHFAPGATYPAGLPAPTSVSPPSWTLLGSPTGAVQTHGDLSFYLDAVGAPLAAAAGSDLNMHALLVP